MALFRVRSTRKINSGEGAQTFGHFGMGEGFSRVKGVFVETLFAGTGLETISHAVSGVLLREKSEDERLVMAELEKCMK